MFADGKKLTKKKNESGIVAYEDDDIKEKGGDIKWNIKILKNGSYEIKIGKNCLTNTEKEDKPNSKRFYIVAKECKKESKENQQWNIRMLNFESEEKSNPQNDESEEKKNPLNDESSEIHKDASKPLSKALSQSKNITNPFKDVKPKSKPDANSIIGNDDPFKYINSDITSAIDDYNRESDILVVSNQPHDIIIGT